MKLSHQEQESIIALLVRIYTDIRDIEEEFELLVGDHDFRPRIEYFHDAIQALTSQDPAHFKAGGRLSVEFLAHDLSCLRYLESMPLSSFKPNAALLSPSTEMVAVKQGLVAKRSRPDRAVRERISELYQTYAVLFAALLKPLADRDYHDRIDDLNQDVQDLKDLVAQLNALAVGKNVLDKVTAAIQHLEEADLRHELMNFIQQQKHKKKENLEKLAHFLKNQMAERDKRIAAIDAAHMNYSLSQLGIFEGSKDMLKKMAGQGMNLVGKFVEASIAESKREMGR